MLVLLRLAAVRWGLRGGLLWRSRLRMEELPEELVHTILGLLDERTLRCAVPRVCRLWARLAATRGVWAHVPLAFEREADFAERAG